MLSYQHAYHAGCLADVHKHSLLLRVLSALKTQEPQPLTYIETHSGRGLYQLDSAEAQKTGEAQQGILRLQAEGWLDDTQPLTPLLRRIRRKHGDMAYPGSPLLAQTMLRPQDKLHLFELHPAEHGALVQNLRGHNLRVYKQDGYAGALRLSPPPSRKGLVLVDPSYEVKEEYQDVVRFVRALLRKWPEAVLLVWYPLLKAGNHVSMVERLEEARFRGYWHQEVEFCDPEAVRGMYGSGAVAVNLPQGLAEVLEQVEPLKMG